MNKAYYTKINQSSFQLLAYFKELKSVFQFPLQYLLQVDTKIKIRSRNELQDLLLTLETNISHFARKIDAKYAIPILIQSATDLYQRKIDMPLHQKGIGLALKASCTFLFDNVTDDEAPAKYASLEALYDLVSAVLLYESLQGLFLIYYMNEEIEISIRETGIVANRDHHAMNQELYKLTSRNNSFRTTSDVVRVVWKDLMLFQENVLKILKTKKNDIEAFQNTIFQSIPGDCTEFWFGVFFRLFLCNHLIEQRHGFFKKGNVDDFVGIQVFSKFKISMSEIADADPALIDSYIKSLFWSKSMKQSGCLNERGNLLSHLPLVRISKTPSLFVSSPYFIMDSLFNFIEASVLNYKRPRLASIPRCVFNDFVSKPFEQRTMKLLAQICERVGEVSNKGVWKVGDEFHKLSKQKIPGQIDVLAVDDQRKILYVVEVKVLNDPVDVNSFRNLVKKVGVEDDVGFHAKLSKKIDWVKTKVDAFKDYEAIGILVLDKYIPLGWQAENIVLDIEHLETLVSSKQLAEYCLSNKLLQ